MLGVVLWSDPSDRKAVIWCEDQGDLAFLNAPDDVLSKDDFFDAGDLVQFDMDEVSSLRRVQNPRLLLEQAGADLPEALRRRSRSFPARPQGPAEVVSLSRYEAPDIEPRRRVSQA